MFSLKDISIPSRAESTLLRLSEDLIGRMEDDDVRVGASKFTYFNELRKRIEVGDRLHVNPGIAPDRPRYSRDMDEYFGNIALVIARDLERVRKSYDYLNTLEERINQTSNDIGNIPDKIKSTINKILTDNRQRSILEDNIEVMNFAAAADVESGNGFHDTEAQVLTVSGELTDATGSTTVTIGSVTPLYTQNIYERFTEDIVESLSVDTTYYDTTSGTLILIYQVTNPDGIDVIDIALDRPFKVSRVEVDASGNGSFLDVSRDILGSALVVRGTAYVPLKDESYFSKQEVYRKGLVFPESYTDVKVFVHIEEGDLYPFLTSQLIDNHGDVTKEYGVKESLTLQGILRNELSKTVDGKVFVQNLLEEVKTGTVVNVLNMLPYRRITPGEVRVSRLGARANASSRLRTTTGGRKIESVEIYVDAFDPQEVISYYVDHTRNDRLPIAPVNSNSDVPIRVDFTGTLPTSVSVIVDIPSDSGYLPILRSVAVRLKESVV